MVLWVFLNLFPGCGVFFSVPLTNSLPVNEVGEKFVLTLKLGNYVSPNKG